MDYFLMCEYIRNLLRIRFRCLLLCGFSFAISSYSYGIFAGALLTDNELADVSAGAPGPVPDPTGDRPGVADDLSIVGEPALGLSGALQAVDDEARDNISAAIDENLIVEAGSHATIERTNQVRLSHSSQAGLEVVNLSNTSRSSVANGLNINTDSASLLTHQNNQIEQNEFQQASHGTNSNIERVSTSTIRHEIASNFSNQVINEVYNDIYYRSVTSSAITDVAIEPFSPEVFFDLLEIGTIIPEFSLNIIPSVSFDGTYTDPFDGEWGLKGSYSGLTLTGPTLAVNGLRPEGDDLYLEVEFNLPRLEMGTITVEGCLSECEDLSLNLGGIGGGSVIENNEIRLEGMNPLKDLELNLNTGLVTAGRGQFSASDSSVGISGELEVNLGAFFEFSLDLSDYWWVDDLFGQNKWSHRAELDYEIDIPFTILEHQVDGFDMNFDGSMCLKLFGSNTSCGHLESSYQESFYADNSASFNQTDSFAASNTINESNSYAAVHGGILTGAEAELIIMTDSDLQLNSDSDVNIKDGAQQELKAVNVVNSASAVSANSLNMDIARRVQVSPLVSSGVLLNQRNYFNQRL
ncbi:MAG: hypothetical protein OQK70_10235 [Gammaproteobacteria bacterium]|nr:hypothetical protein [Gammaproteobacteria bacterium]